MSLVFHARFTDLEHDGAEVLVVPVERLPQPQRLPVQLKVRRVLRRLLRVGQLQADVVAREAGDGELLGRGPLRRLLPEGLDHVQDDVGVASQHGAGGGQQRRRRREGCNLQAVVELRVAIRWGENRV